MSAAGRTVHFPVTLQGWIQVEFPPEGEPAITAVDLSEEPPALRLVYDEPGPWGAAGQVGAFEAGEYGEDYAGQRDLSDEEARGLFEKVLTLDVGPLRKIEVDGVTIWNDL